MLTIRALTVVLLLAAPAGAATDLYAPARDAYLKLKSDPEKRLWRNNWLAVAKRLETVAKQDAGHAAEAIFLSGEAYAELAKFSKQPEDRLLAEKAYRRVVETWPKSRLADDAALVVARSLQQRGDNAGAQRFLGAAVSKASDRKKELAALLASIPASKSGAATKLGARQKSESATASSKTAAAESKSRGESAASSKSGGASQAAKSGAESAGSKSASESASTMSRAGSKAVSSPSKSGSSALAMATSRAALDPARPSGSATTARGSAAPVVRPAAIARSSAPQVARPSPEPSTALSDAIARLARTVKPLDSDKEEAHGRRLPMMRAPPTNEADSSARETDEVQEDNRAPLVQSLAERLRDVRVGVSGESLAEARGRLKHAADSSSDISLAQQLGLKFKRVIIDAGHGGHDTGAIGPKGTREKDVALAIAKRLARLLEAQGLAVLLTRDDDSFVALEERTRFANANRGDLFISVHCNAAPNHSLRGIETYSLNTSSNRYAIRLAARENATTERGVGDLQYILADLATKANTGESTRLAEMVQSGVVERLSREWKGIKSLGTKEALFFVLLGAKMPAILVETSFLSHPEEELRLADDAYQSRVAEGIAEAVSSFLDARTRMAQVD